MMIRICSNLLSSLTLAILLSIYQELLSTRGRVSPSRLGCNSLPVPECSLLVIPPHLEHATVRRLIVLLLVNSKRGQNCPTAESVFLFLALMGLRSKSSPTMINHHGPKLRTAMDLASCSIPQTAHLITTFLKAGQLAVRAAHRVLVRIKLFSPAILTRI